MKWFKALFSKQEEESVKIDITNLEQWFNEQTQTKLSTFKRDIRTLFSDIETKITYMKTNLKLLEQAEIKDKIEQRIKLVVLGNKDTYIKQVRLFLEKIKIPVEITYESALEYYPNFEKNLKDLDERTKKNYQIIEQLLGEEINKVTLSIKDIYQAVEEIKAILQKKEIVSTKDCQKKIKRFREKIEASEKIKNKIKENKIKKAEKEILRKEAIEKISLLKNSEEYSNLTELKKQKEEIEKEIINTEAKINEIFRSLERVFKKFQNMNKVQLVEKYLKTPSIAFSQDSDLRILGYLKEIEQLVNQNKIEIKDKKKEKILEALKGMDKTKLKDLYDKYSTLKSKNGRFKSKILSDNLTEKFMFLENRLNKTEKEMEELNEKSKTIEEIKEKINIEEEKKQIEDSIQELLNHKIEIK